MTTAQAVLLAAARDAAERLDDHFNRRTPPNWSMTTDLGVLRLLMAAMRHVAREEQRRVLATEEWMTPGHTLLTSPDPALKDMQVLASETLLLADKLARATYRETPLSRDEHALLLGAIDHALHRLGPLHHYLDYRSRTEKL